MIKSFRMTVKIANNQLRQRREELGLTQREAGEASGIGSAWTEFENMKRKPTIKVMEGFGPCRHVVGVTWSKSALRVADFLCVEPEVLWPVEVQAITANHFSVNIDGQQMMQIAEGNAPSPDDALELGELKEAVGRMLDTLRPREAMVLRMRFGIDGGDGATLETIGDTLGVCKERARHILHGAMSRIRRGQSRNPSANGILKAVREIADD